MLIICLSSDEPVYWRASPISVNRHWCTWSIRNGGWWIFSLSIFFPVNLFWNKREGIMRLNEVYLFSKSFCTFLILLWMHKGFVKASCILFVSKSKPQVLWCSSASPVTQLVRGAETIVQASWAGRQRRSHAGCCCARLWAAEHCSGRKHLRAARGSG